MFALESRTAQEIVWSACSSVCRRPVTHFTISLEKAEFTERGTKSNKKALDSQGCGGGNNGEKLKDPGEQHHYEEHNRPAVSYLERCRFGGIFYRTNERPPLSSPTSQNSKPHEPSETHPHGYTPLDAITLPSRVTSVHSVMSSFTGARQNS